MNAKFTIFVPVHNGGEHLKRCVESVLAQTLPDFDLVILENDSTDGSREWLATMRDPRVSVLPSERLLPIEENWGRALALPKNEFMTIFGHDDLMDPGYLAVMDELSMILLTIPIFFPLVIGLDFGMPRESVAIWFGIMVLMTVGFGLLAPPVGLNVYVVNGMAKGIPIAESYRGVLPFLVSDALRTLLLLAFPPISLALVRYVG